MKAIYENDLQLSQPEYLITAIHGFDYPAVKLESNGVTLVHSGDHRIRFNELIAAGLTAEQALSATCEITELFESEKVRLRSQQREGNVVKLAM